MQLHRGPVEVVVRKAPSRSLGVRQFSSGGEGPEVLIVRRLGSGMCSASDLHMSPTLTVSGDCTSPDTERL